MDIVYKNTFTMTLERYLYFCDNPVGAEAKRRFRSWKLRNIWCIVLSILCALLCFVLKEWLGLYMFAVACSLFFYRLLYQRKRLNKKLYNSLLRAQDSNEWIRTTIFTDVIKVQEGNTESIYEYSYIERITEDDIYFYLWHNSDFVFRLPKDSFIIGNSKEFKNFIIDRIFENRTSS
nr:YcxB family protein [uncultured Clostridium sp.]